MSDALKDALRWTAAALQEVFRTNPNVSEFDRIVIDGSSATVREILNRADAALAPAVTAPAAGVTIADAEAIGANGAPHTEAERLLFEAWMKGHCWALSATWRGSQYKSDAEDSSYIDPRAMATRRLWAAWCARAALAPAAQGAEPVGDALLQGGMTNAELLEAWHSKLRNVVPTDREMSAFALGIEIGAERRDPDAAPQQPDTGEKS